MVIRFVVFRRDGGFPTDRSRGGNFAKYESAVAAATLNSMPRGAGKFTNVTIALDFKLDGERESEGGRVESEKGVCELMRYSEWNLMAPR